MARNETFGKDLLHVENYQNLLKNYNSLKTSKNYVECKVTDDRKCTIINQIEISRALSLYFDKMSSVREMENKKVLKVCQNTEKLQDTVQIEQHCKVTSPNYANKSNINFGKYDSQSSKRNSSHCVGPSSEVLPRTQADMVNNELTPDDFLTIQDENHLQYHEPDIYLLQNNEKLKPREMMQDNLPALEHINKKIDLPCSDKSEKETEKIENLSTRHDEILSQPQPSTERPYICPKCEMAFKRNLHLKRHFIVAHTPKKNFKCNICQKRFSRKDYLDKHTIGHQKKNLKIKLLEQGIVIRTKIFSKLNK